MLPDDDIGCKFDGLMETDPGPFPEWEAMPVGKGWRAKLASLFRISNKLYSISFNLSMS